jgi:carbon-monoxide dehydrogenase large subunit
LLSGFTLGIPENKLRVISPDVGGGFGSKIFHYPEEVIVPWVARATNRPVKWVASRSESYMTDAHGRDHITSCKMAFKKDGTITGLQVSNWANMGAYLSTFAPLIPTALYITVSPACKIPAIWVKQGHHDQYGACRCLPRCRTPEALRLNAWWTWLPGTWYGCWRSAQTLSP